MPSEYLQRHELKRAQEYVIQLLIENDVPFTETEEAAVKAAMEAAWDGTKYAMKAEKYNININTLRNYGANLWRNLSRLLERNISPDTFKLYITEVLAEIDKFDVSEAGVQEAVDIYQRDSSNDPETSIDSKVSAEVINPEYQTSGKEAHLVTSVQVNGAKLPTTPIYGREAEIEKLDNLIRRYSCVMIVGVQGIGKRSLVSKFLRVTPDLPFSKVLWKPLHHKPTVEELQMELIYLLEEEGSGTSIITQLRHQERLNKTYLIVLEGLDSLVHIDGNDRYIDEDYVSIIRRVTEETNSKIILTTTISLEQLKFIVLDGFGISFTLHGLPVSDAQHLLTDDFQGDKKIMIELLGGHPELLKRLSNWSKTAGKLNPKLAVRETLVGAVISDFCNWLQDDRYINESDKIILAKIATAKDKKGLTFQRVLQSYPNSALRLMELMEMGIVRGDVDSGQLWLRLDRVVEQYILVQRYE